MLAKHPFSNMALSAKEDLEEFFHSDWFKFLSDIDPEVLITKINTGVVA